MWVTIVISGALGSRAAPGQPHERQSGADPYDVPQAGHYRGIDAERGVESQEPEQEIERAFLRAHLERHHEQRVEDQGRQPTDEVRRQVTRAHADAEEDQPVFAHEDAAAQILETERREEAPAIAVVELREYWLIFLSVGVSAG